MTEKKPPPDHKPKGRPRIRAGKLDATPEQAARTFFSNVAKPDPSLRTARKKPQRKQGVDVVGKFRV